MFCPNYGMTAPQGNCSAQYYCAGNATTATPTDGVTGDKCPVGHYCPTGTTVPLPCAAGAFSNVTGLSTCHQCPAGYYCLLGADNYVGTPCDPGYYCPAGTTSATQYPCPAGTFYNLTMATSVSDCLPCPGGEFCATPGLSAPTGKCSPGKNEFVK